jgi:thiamine-monophosphate kinase
MRRLRDIGESGLIARIERRLARATRSPRVRLGIGDDAALLRSRADEDWVTSSDALVEDVHFRFANQAATTIGRRALAVNLSDLAAMGATPIACTLSLAAPPELPLQLADGLVAGFVEAGIRWRCPLVGGNVTAARETSLHVSVFGGVAAGQSLRRGAVRKGDRIGVTGTLGSKALERARVERNGGRIRRVPEPRLRAGRALLATPGHGGCIDVSDGLLRDLEALLGSSGLSAEIDPAAVPTARGFRSAALKEGLDPDRLALTGGEDYELLFSLRPGGPTCAALSRRMGCRVTEIGRVVSAPGLHGVPEALLGHPGWRHF